MFNMGKKVALEKKSKQLLPFFHIIFLKISKETNKTTLLKNANNNNLMTVGIKQLFYKTLKCQQNCHNIITFIPS